MGRLPLPRPVRTIAGCALAALLVSRPSLGTPRAVHATTLTSTVFLDTTTNTIAVATAGSAGTISYTIADLGGRQLGSGGPLQVTGQQAIVTLPREPDGYYTLEVLDQTTRPALRQRISYAVLAPYTLPKDSPFGLNTHLLPAGMAPLVAGAGATWARLDIAWADVEHTPGHYSFVAYDAAMQELRDNGITPLPILDYGNGLYDGGRTPYSARGYSAFASYVAALVSHYHGQLKAVEVWNEYNGRFSDGPCWHQPKCYATLLRYAQHAIKSVDPSIAVIGGATFGIDPSFMARVCDAGGLPYMDAESNHPYMRGQLDAPERGIPLDQAEQSLGSQIARDNRGQPKPIWVTEFGWPADSAHVDERTQAAYLVRGMVLALAGGVRRAFWYDLLDDSANPTGAEAHFGLLRQSDLAGRYTPKPALVAFAVLARQLGDASFVTGQALRQGLYDEVFAAPKAGTTQLLWSTVGPRTLTLATTNAVTVVSMTGQTYTARPTNGLITLTIAGDPVYLHTMGMPHAS